MLKYHIYFLFLKVIIFVQFSLIFLQKESVNSIYYIIFDIIFKISLGLFLMAFFVAQRFREIDFIDRYIIFLAGSLLLFDVGTGGLPKLLSKYNITLPSWWPVQKP